MNRVEEARTIDTNELLASLRVLAHVARADARIAKEEKLVLGGAGAAEVGRSVSELLGETTDLEEQIRRVRSPALQARTLAEAIALAYVDGLCSPEEHAILVRLRQSFGGPDLEEAGAHWKQRGAALRAALDEATTTYLHTVSEDSRRGDLSQSRYDQHVAALAKDKLELQRAFLADAD